MARRKTRTLTDLEFAVMQAVWAKSEATVEEIQHTLGEQDRPLALPSIRTMLSILQNKNYVTRKRVGRRFVYQATVPAAQAKKRILKDLIDRVFDGSVSGLVAALVTQGMVGKDDLIEARKLIRQREDEK